MSFPRRRESRKASLHAGFPPTREWQLLYNKLRYLKLIYYTTRWTHKLVSVRIHGRESSWRGAIGLVAWLDRPYKQSYFSRRLRFAQPTILIGFARLWPRSLNEYNRRKRLDHRATYGGSWWRFFCFFNHGFNHFEPGSWTDTQIEL